MNTSTHASPLPARMRRYRALILVALLALLLPTLLPMQPATLFAAPAAAGPRQGEDINYAGPPPTTLTTASSLYVSPNDTVTVGDTVIPAGSTVYVMGRNQAATNLRVVWNVNAGWVPVTVTALRGKASDIDKLPVYRREPPACVDVIGTQFNINSTWRSTRQQRVAVIIDLFRERLGEFPESHLSLKINGREVVESRRAIVEQGQFSLFDVVFTLPQEIRRGDRLGYILDTDSEENINFMATIFRVPQSCKWEGVS